MSAASRSRSSGPQRAGAGQRSGDRRWPCCRWWVSSSSSAAASGSVAGGADEDAVDRRDPRVHLRGDRRRSPRAARRGSGRSSSARTCGRSAIGTSSSSPTMETSSRALRMPCFDENSRYTVAAGTSASSLIASIVVAP